MTPLLKAEIFEFYMREIAKELRGRYEQADISRLRFEAKASGQVLTGDLLIEFKVSDGEYSESVTAGTVQAALEEFLRRKGWTEQNAALCLPRVESGQMADTVAEDLDLPPPETPV